MAVNSGNTQAMTIAGLNHIQQALTIYDTDLKLVVANARFSEMFGLPSSLMTAGAGFEETVRYIANRGEYGLVDDVDAFVKERVDRALAFEPHYVERQRDNGRWISVEGSPLPDGGWIAVYTDISRSRRQEDLLRGRSEELSDQLTQYSEELWSTNRKLEATVIALEEAKRQLTESEARTRLTTEMMPAHIAHVGPDRHYTYSNRRLSNVMPGRSNDILGRSISGALGTSAYTAIKPYLDQAFSGTASVFEFNDQMSARRIRTSFTPDGEAETARGVYIMSMDITEEVQTRSALQQIRRRQLAAQMTSGLAHDFSNLLTIILGMQSKLGRMDLRDGARELVQATLGAAKRGGALLNRIADVTERRVPKLRATDIKYFLSELHILAGPALPPEMTLEIDDAVGNAHLLVDPDMLQDSLLNLILNARDACHSTGCIHLSAKIVQDTWLEFEVQDTGSGFSAEALEHALDPFFTTKGSEGSGLGLAMVYDSTKLLGGEVRLANLDEGARVTLRLPLRYARTGHQADLVLLVEDNPDLRSTVRNMLTDLGHNVIEATSVEESLGLLAQVPEISLLLTDVKLEGAATGIDLVGAMATRGIPSFLMTSLSQNDPMYMQGAAIAPILPKPFSAEQLSAFLQPKVKP